MNMHTRYGKICNPLSKKQNQTQWPVVVNLTQENIIYMKGIPLLTFFENEQLSEIIQEVKQQTYSSRRNERQTYEAISRNAHLRKSMIQIKKFREANSRDISFCEKLIEANDRRA